MNLPYEIAYDKAISRCVKPKSVPEILGAGYPKLKIQKDTHN